MNTGFFNVFHDHANHGRLAVGNAIDVDLDCVFQKTIDQDGAIRRYFNCARHVSAEIRLIINELHRAAAENKARSDQNWITNLACDLYRFVRVHGRTTRRLTQSKLVQHRCEKFSIFRGLDALRLRAENRNAGRFQSVREVERRLSAELHHHAFGPLLLIYIENVLQRERLEIEFVARVVIGRNRFRIRVHHDRFEPELAQRERGVHAAVIELDSLADAIWSASKNHYFTFPAFAPLVLVAVSGIIIRRISFELRRTGIDQAIRRRHFFGDAFRSNFFFG